MENEEKIIAKCQAGDKEAFSVLYDFYIAKIYNFVFYKVFSKTEAEDLVSQVFLKALKNINKFTTKEGNFSAWLYRIARNTVIDYYRSNHDNYDIEDFWDLPADDNMFNELNVKLEFGRVKDLLQKFKPVQREIIIMRLWDELSYAEIAKVLNLSETNCRMIFSRAISDLRGDAAQWLLLLIISKQIICLMK
ncbi:MAG: sigma-70 family RNA polymerase sigma factor [Candidatus Falkowbacteria bacterium]